ncbi:hypothetical protein RND81_01G191500 [Saponaria officinalis]|uniref:Cyanobacterial aminoacyl-tRNA synthetase CAAD domain-containing protein n=1 Tax=Saponaria officinalis TaxID=3572 RepID=A0AAW1NJQ7_SAPOF
MAAIYGVTTTTSSTMAAATTGLLPRVQTNHVSPFLPLPYLQPRTSVPSLRISLESRRFSSFQIKASSTEETSSVDTAELFDDLKEKWDKLENKSTVLVYGGGAIVAVWLSSILVGAINSVPLLPKIMELVGLGYTGWFVYRYLLFKSSRKELAEDIESLKKKIAGTE